MPSGSKMRLWANFRSDWPLACFTTSDSRKYPELLYCHSLPGAKLRARWRTMRSSASSSVVQFWEGSPARVSSVV